MKTIEYRFIDKSEYEQGPWTEEPDKIQWPDEATGLPCLVTRQHHFGHLCGYVGVPEGHPLYGMDYNDLPNEIYAHGGITFADACQEHEDGVCHIPDPGEPDNVWWFGFDCAHLMDFKPFEDQKIRDALGRVNKRHGEEAPEEVLSLLGLGRGTVYRDLKYVQENCRSLAEQLASFGK